MVKAIVVDLDGVLFDVSERIRRCLEEVGVDDLSKADSKQRRRFWNLFLSPKYMYLDRPNLDVVAHVKLMKRSGYRIIIVTGRVEETQKYATLNQLRRYEIPVDEIYFRKKGDYRKDYELKLEVIRHLLDVGYEIEEVWDDSERVIEALKNILPNTKLVLYRNPIAEYRVRGR
ncbi:MAG: hypothetical protein DRJ40_11390 [Thermoprotei archaeon]|nr:MAG: hypothetical protein DRJ40_11390 [Thermoprotei archaeon]